MKRQALLVLVTVAGLYGCATTEELAARDGAFCDGVGIPAGDPSRLQCVAAAAKIRQDEARDRYARISATLNNTGRALNQSDTPSQPHVGIKPQQMGCMKTSEYAAAFNKVCNYSCMGSPYSVTISSTSLCPLQP